MSDDNEMLDTLRLLRTQLGSVLVGMVGVIDRLLIGLITGGHILLEGFPGLAKTLAARALSRAVHAHFQRVQFTPDLLPADLVGSEVYHPQTGDFSIRRGPIFTQILLADEINRAPAKVQSALLEAMQERQVTIGNETMPLPEPFLVLATQNPIEHEGTFPLPEAQVDRFLMKVKVGYPSREDEARILDRLAFTSSQATQASFGPPVVEPSAILRMRSRVDGIHVDLKVRDYVLDLVRATRSEETLARLGLGKRIQLGASPRASIALLLSGRAHALLNSRDYVVPHDIKSIAHDVLRHRLILSFEAEAEGQTPDAVLNQLLAEVPVP